VPSEATESRVKGCGWHGMQGVRGSNPLSSTPGQRPSSASTAPDSPASGSRWAAICVAWPIQSSDAAGCCRCRRPGSPGPAGGRRLGRFSWLRSLLWPHRVPNVARAPRFPTRQRARIWPRPAHQFHPPGWRAWQPVARLESSPAAKTDGGNRLEPLILAVFIRVRLIRLRPAWFACVAFALVSRGVAALVIQGGTGPCGSVQISWAEQPAESGPRAYVSGWSRVSLMPPARPASHARRWSSIPNRRPLRRASETHCRDAPGLIPLCSRRCRRTLALGRPHLRRA